MLNSDWSEGFDYLEWQIIFLMDAPHKLNESNQMPCCYLKLSTMRCLSFQEGVSSDTLCETASGVDECVHDVWVLNKEEITFTAAFRSERTLSPARAALLHDLCSVISWQLAEAVITVDHGPLHDLSVPQQKTGIWARNRRQTGRTSQEELVKVCAIWTNPGNKTGNESHQPPELKCLPIPQKELKNGDVWAAPISVTSLTLTKTFLKIDI